MTKENEATATAASVPEGSPEANDSNDNVKGESSKSPPSRRNLYLALGVVFLAVVALCIALPLALKDRGNDSQSSTASSTEASTTGGTGNTAGSTGAAETKDPNVQVGGEVVVLKDMTIPLFGTQITNGYANQQELEAALTVALRTQAQNIIHKKLQEQEFQEEALRETDQAAGPPPMAMADGGVAEESASFSSLAAGGAADAADAGGVTDFETNNQEENVDEADIIKADANFVYAAYGDYILIWDTNGKKIAQVAMPSIDLPENWGQPETVEKAQAKSMLAPDHVWIPKPHISSMLLTDNHLIAIVQGYGHDYHWGAPPVGQETVSRILYDYQASQLRLYEKSATGNLTFVGKKDVNGHYIDARSVGDVVHIATGTGVDMWTHLWGPLDRWNFEEDIADEDYEIQAMDLAEQTLIPTMARQLASELQTSDGSIPNMLQINQWMTQLTDTDTEDDATDGATPNVIPFDQYDVISNVAQVTSFNVNSPSVSYSGEEELDVSTSAYMAPSYFDTLYGTEDHLVLATSGWDWNATLGESTQTTYLVALSIDSNDASTSFLSVGHLKGHLLNSYALDIYGDELRAATTVERNRWWWGRPGPMPFVDPVMVEDVAVEAVSAQAVEEEPVASLQSSNQCVEPTTDEDCISQESYNQCLAIANAGCEVVVQSIDCPPLFSCADDRAGLCPVPGNGDNCVDADNYKECLNLVKEGCSELNILESCPVQYECGVFGGDELPIFPPVPPPPEDDESRTENYMTVLKLTGGSTPGQMEKKGDVMIGEKHERITAVRFFDNVAYAVTFERTDPFYVLDMSVPAVLGELKLPGFSSYLHSMNAENTLLLAVGQNATDNGVVTGLMVTVFDATNPADPRALVSHTFEQDPNAHSSSNVEWDYKAFRYVDGKLVIPLSIWYYQEWNQTTQQLDPLPDGVENFQGFAVLSVSTTSITEQYRISHKKDEGECHYCGGFLPTRSFVYSGDLMTVRDNVVVSTGLNSGEEVWRLFLSVDGESAECCW
ncbi:beta propeller domain protein [Seminavis robusta]|uniref:Beta propeller domain protein n=1 Tax=Seminavis robusta TaxID=568900 RepID=A0A9N8D4H5_9STRA|nr:beta propeller domain protein [Seminavis robusta]|eukprot:Sro3_g002230.1 beta propeller domain protein (1008) ;mRNA; f:93564-96694